MFTAVDDSYRVELYYSLIEVYLSFKDKGYSIFDYGDLTLENLEQAFTYERNIFLIDDHYHLGSDWIYKIQKH